MQLFDGFSGVFTVNINFKNRNSLERIFILENEFILKGFYNKFFKTNASMSQHKVFTQWLVVIRQGIGRTNN